MADKPPVFYAACVLTALCLLIAAALAFFGPDPPSQPIGRLFDALIYISIAGALTIFGLLGYRAEKKPPGPN